MARRKRKQTFPCGHQGQGQECQRCKQEAEEAERQTRQQAALQRQKVEWAASFDQDLVDLRGLPKPIIVKARQVIDALQDGEDHRRFKGKRMRVDSTLIRIPINADYRLIVRHSGKSLTMLEVLSHEAYNKKYGKNQRKVG